MIFISCSIKNINYISSTEEIFLLFWKYYNFCYMIKGYIKYINECPPHKIINCHHHIYQINVIKEHYANSSIAGYLCINLLTKCCPLGYFAPAQFVIYCFQCNKNILWSVSFQCPDNHSDTFMMKTCLGERHYLVV